MPGTPPAALLDARAAAEGEAMRPDHYPRPLPDCVMRTSVGEDRDPSGPAWLGWLLRHTPARIRAAVHAVVLADLSRAPVLIRYSLLSRNVLALDRRVDGAPRFYAQSLRLIDFVRAALAWRAHERGEDVLFWHAAIGRACPAET
jgi:hypothetical protein